MNTQANEVTISVESLRAAFAAVLPHVSTDETRVHLNSVLIEVSENTLTIVGTDGTTLAKWEEHTTGPDASIMLRLSDALTLQKKLRDVDAKQNPKGGVTISQTSQGVYVESWQSVATYRVVEAQFPPYRQVVPSYGGTTTGRTVFDVALIDRAAKSIAGAAKFYGKKRCTEFHIEMAGELDPCIVTSNAVPNLTIVLMPMRADYSPKSFVARNESMKDAAE